MKSIKLFITDDHQLILDSMEYMIREIAGFELLGKSASGEKLLSSLEAMKEKPDICLIDIQMPGLNGFETVRQLKERYPDIKAVALTMHRDDFFINRMIVAGASGYLLKNVDKDTFEQYVRQVFMGVEFKVLGEPARREESEGEADPESLTSREKQIINLISLGKSSKEISDALHISPRTVDTHRNNLKKKLKVSSIAELVKYAFENNLR